MQCPLSLSTSCYEQTQNENEFELCTRAVRLVELVLGPPSMRFCGTTPGGIGTGKRYPSTSCGVRKSQSEAVLPFCSWTWSWCRRRWICRSGEGAEPESVHRVSPPPGPVVEKFQGWRAEEAEGRRNNCSRAREPVQFQNLRLEGQPSAGYGFICRGRPEGAVNKRKTHVENDVQQSRTFEHYTW